MKISETIVYVENEIVPISITKNDYSITVETIKDYPYRGSAKNYFSDESYEDEDI